MLARPDVTPAQVAIAHRYLAALGVMLGDESGAAQHARLAVALRPEADAPEGSPAEVQSLLDAAREATGGEALTLDLEPRGALTVGAPGRVAATVRPLDLPFSPTVRLACESGGGEETTAGALPEVTLEFTPRGASVTCRGSVHSAAGAELVSSLSSFDVAPSEAGADDGVLIGALVGGIGGAVLVAVVVAIAVVVTAPQQASFAPPSVEGW